MADRPSRIRRVQPRGTGRFERPALLCDGSIRRRAEALAQDMEAPGGAVKAQPYREQTEQWISPGILTIAAPTPYLRDWLTERLTTTLSRLLCGILAQPVSLLFECGP